MKANELMIGDWVMVNDVEHTHPLQVAEIFKKCGAYYATLYWDGMPDNVNPETLTADIDKVLPIPLTPEILEKNGFVCTQKADEMETSYECWSFHDGLLSIIFEPDVVMLEVHNGGENGDAVRTIPYYTDNDIMYLHELQHALRLCGIKKEIEL